MEKIIGIVGGAGPFAGLDLHTKILQHTAAPTDQDHLTILNLSQSNQLPDRTAYLLGETAVNPAHAIFQQLQILEQAGAQVAAIPCNTAHAPAIYDELLVQLNTAGSNLKFLHLIRETADYLCRHFPHIHRVGVLSTTGTFRTRIYPELLEPAGFSVLIPDEHVQETAVHVAIYHPEYGIKTHGTSTPKAQQKLHLGLNNLRQKGAEAIILGCTEIPLAITATEIDSMAIIDPTIILARALIREANPAKLRP